MKRRFKYLPLQSPFIYEKDYWDNCIKEENRIEPIFNKNGYYLDRKENKTWLEIDGEAWLYGNRESWETELRWHPMNYWQPPEVMNALDVLIRNRLADKKLRQIHYDMTSRIMIRETYLNARLHSYQMVKRIKDKIQAKE